MFLVQACLFGGVIYTGLSALIKHRRRTQTDWLSQGQPPVSREPDTTPEAESPEMDEAALSRYLTLTSVSLGLCVVGSLVYAPLRLASVPLTVYSALPTFEQTWASLLRENRLRLAMLQSVLLVLTLATRYYTTAALLIWSDYYMALVGQRLRRFIRQVRQSLEQDYPEVMAQFSGDIPSSVWVEAQGVEMEVPVEHLRVGDIVVVQTGETILVEGTVVEGTAEIGLFPLTGQMRRVTAKEGDHVVPLTMVVSGKIRLSVDRL